jgi:OOP family OmpA-OmpF porin
MRKASLLVSLLALLLAPCILAQDPDAEGCKDSPLITRMPDSSIHSCDRKEFDQVSFQVAKDKDGNVVEKTLEGELFSWDYGNREGMSQIQVFRNFETALRQAGFKLVYEESPGLIVAQKGATWYRLENSGDYYHQTVITVNEMQQEVTADASSLADEINKSGHVAIYGIHFDTGKAVILPDSEEILGQIVKVMQNNADWKLRVEGYTDNVGAPAANQTLSEKRAQAVVDWLAAHGVEKSRLAAKGFGATNPVADNTTDAGRAKNRRVELAKM